MLALAVTRFRPVAVAICVAAAAAAVAWYWRSQNRLRSRIAAAAVALAVLGIAVLTRVNIYELMFHPLERPAYSAASKAKLDGGRDGHHRQGSAGARAPTRSAASLITTSSTTCWAACRSPRLIERSVTPVWCGGREIDGLRLTFHLAGINNQNFLMRDEETGTYWQQISGARRFGTARGSQLTWFPPTS